MKAPPICSWYRYMRVFATNDRTLLECQLILEHNIYVGLTSTSTGNRRRPRVVLKIVRLGW